MPQQAIVVHSLGFNASKLETRAVPKPGANEVLVKVLVAGLNLHDAKALAVGLFIAPLLEKVGSAILACDVVGEIVALGENVTEFSVGQRIMSQAGFFQSLDRGGLQEYCLLYARWSAVVPAEISSDGAATLPVNAVTPWAAMFSKEGFGLPPPGTEDAKAFPYSTSSILIVGGGANTGIYAAQYARVAGFGKVIVVAGSSPSAVTKLKKMGATHVIDRHGGDEQIIAQIREIVEDTLVYALDMASPKGEYNIAISSLSNDKHGTAIWITAGLEPPQENYPQKKAGFSGRHIRGSAAALSENRGELFWKDLPGQLVRQEIVPIENGWAKTIEGLDVTAVDEGLLAMHQGKRGRFHVHPHAKRL
jgi:NADPH2:quinone reductase